MRTSPRVLVVHARGRWTGLGRLPGLLHAAGAHVTAFSPAGSYLRLSRFVDAHVPGATGEADFIPTLKAYLAGHRHEYDWVLLGDENGVSDLACSGGDTDWLRGWFPVDVNRAAMSVIVSKTAFAAAAIPGGVAMPASHVCTTLAQARDAAAALSFPVILKAAHSFAGVGVRKATTAAELDARFDELRAGADEVLVQRFEVGRVGSTQLLLDHGRVAAWVAAYKCCCHPEPYGPSSSRQRLHHPDMERLLHAVGRVTGFHGMCGVDWMVRQRDGHLMALEFNPRPAPVFHLGRRWGVDFAAAIADLLAGERTYRKPGPVGDDRRIYLFPQHLSRTFHMRRWHDLRHWLPGLGNTDIPWDEPRLLRAYLRTLMGQAATGVLLDVDRAVHKLFKRRPAAKQVEPVLDDESAPLAPAPAKVAPNRAA